MALVPEFISVLRDIRDVKYPEMENMLASVIDYNAQTETLYNLTLNIKVQTESIRDATQSYYDDTVAYGSQLKIDVELLKDATQLAYNNTLLIKADVEQMETNVENMKDETNETYQKMLALSEGLGFTINDDGHMIVTIPAGSNLDNIYIDTNGHLIVTIT